MKAFLGVIVFSLALYFSCSAMAADTFKDEAAVKKFTDDFMEKVGIGDHAAAYKILKPYVIMNDVEFASGVDKSNKERQDLAMRYGPSKRHLFLRENKVGKLIYRLQYIEETEKQALVWSFYFYKSGDKWRLDEFGWTEQISGLFEAK